MEIEIYRNSPKWEYVVHIKDKNIFVQFPNMEDAEDFVLKLIDRQRIN